ncbi:hypothetical protein [Peptostreptococcus porci]|uniref:hypothetical protein n=1 Tax=Peptostreptococcus porci TaxID=2652282 RepID=UPI002A7F2906|nr:hypothetical protein [Peptostreptococcus porci]MDY4128091.1 hypothetical protein [Peptostreptococcus porci]MDY5435279.1 hypothetical protein [Peptostreptococcus porci]
MLEFYNDEKVIASLETKRKLDLKSQGTNMVANCLLGQNKTSGMVPDLYTLILTEKTFYAEYSKSSLHGVKPKKITKLNIPNEDIKEIDLVDKEMDKYLYIKSDWGKEYYFVIDSVEKIGIVSKFIDYFKKA